MIVAVTNPVTCQPVNEDGIPLLWLDLSYNQMRQFIGIENITKELVQSYGWSYRNKSCEYPKFDYYLKPAHKNKPEDTWKVYAFRSKESIERYVIH